MKYLAAFLLLTVAAQAQSIYIEGNGRAQTVEFDPYLNESRTIHFKVENGKRKIVSDVTVPEGVGYIYLYNAATQEGVIEFTRKEHPYYYRPNLFVPMFPTFYTY